mgnify:CR=1 FL=1
MGPTASGKTLCYNLPVLQAALQSQAKALYLFPTKALAQDQVAELLALNKAGGLGVRAFTFDGDTPHAERGEIRRRARIILTNPDMLHVGVLPYHTRWAEFFQNLQWRRMELTAGGGLRYAKVMFDYDAYVYDPGLI